MGESGHPPPLPGAHRSVADSNFTCRNRCTTPLWIMSHLQGARKLEIAAPRSTDEEFLEAFGRLLPKKDLTFEIGPDSIIIHLRRADLDKLRVLHNALCRDFSVEPEKSPARAILDAIESVKSYGVSGKKRVYAGYADERKVQNRKTRALRRGLHFYAQTDGLPPESKLPAVFENKILTGDSAQMLRRLPDGCVDLVFTSPPYNFGLDYHSTEDADFWPRYFEKLFLVFEECIRVTKPGGRIVINIQPLFSDYIPSHHFISRFFTDKGLIWKGEILWEKNNYNCKYTAWGSWKSASNPYLKYTWEFVEIFCKGSLKKAPADQPSDLTADEFKKWVVAKWSIAPERAMKKYGHPAMFPEELARRVIKLFSFPGDVVLDPFNGAGTTTAVAHALGRTYIGIDVSPEYCRVAEERIGTIDL